MKEHKGSITIYDLAKELNLSASTISRALNDHKSIGKKTKKKVKDLAKSKGYRPNSIAASLRNQASKTIGVLVSRIDRPFISSLISGIEEHLKINGYQVIISQSHDSYETEVEQVQTMVESRISALIVSLAMDSVNFEHFTALKDNQIPVVFVDRVPDLNDVERVKINNHSSAYKATEHLIQVGCKRIAHFGGATNQYIYRERLEGYKAALKNHGFLVDDSIILQESFLSAEEGMRMSHEVLSSENPPDAIFCANDTSAVSVIQYARKHGIRIPEDLCVMGFNNDPISTIIEPQLSTINHPALEIGKLAANRVVRILKPNLFQEESLEELHTELIIRQSTNKKNP